MGYYITRQVRKDSSHIVEITRDSEVINGDMLRSDYKGESELWDDPIEAAETAILIRNGWQRDQPNTDIKMAVGSAAGYYPMDAGELREWAAGQVEELQRCEWCGEIIYSGAVRLAESESFTVRYFCSMGCALEYQDDITTPTPDRVAVELEEAIRATEAADSELDHAEQVTRRDIEYIEEHRQNV